jgi:sarcosine oxidase, subunit gamma
LVMLDLDLAVFPVNACARTLFGKAEIVLWRCGDHQFRIEVWRSFAQYVADMLAEAAFGLD